MKNSILNTRNIAKIAILTAVSFLLMLIEFPLPFIAPPFYKIDFSEVAVLVGGFALGPMAGVIIEFLKISLNLAFTGTSTAFVGEIANFIVGCAFVVPAAIIYKKHKTKKAAIYGLVIGSLSMTLVGVVLNYFVVIPAYISIMGFPKEAIIGMAQAIFGFIDNIFKLVIFCTTPFNIIKGILVSIVTAVIYKHISPLLHR